jgi:hypothetical protein
MSALGDSLWKQLGGDVPADPRSVARDAIQRHGSGRAAARALGVDEKTIRRWKAGITKHSDNVDRFAADARARKASQHGGEVQVNLRHAKRDRKLRFAEGAGLKGLTPGTTDAVRDAYVRGDKEGMARELIDGLPSGFYKETIRDAYDAELAGQPGDAGEVSGAVGVLKA